MRITSRGLMMASALIAAGGWFLFDQFGDQAGFGSPVRRESAAAAVPVAGPAKVSGEASDIDLAKINPLNPITLASLTQTIERPLFNRTRVPKPKFEPQVAEQPVEPEIGPQDFTLIGIVVGDDSKTAVLKFNKTNEVFHLKAGQSFSDWQVAEIGPKSVVVKKDELSFPLQLFEQPADTTTGQDDEDAQPQAQYQRPAQFQRPAQQRQRRHLQQQQQIPRANSRKRPVNNNDDSDASDEPQAVSRLEPG